MKLRLIAIFFSVNCYMVCGNSELTDLGEDYTLLPPLYTLNETQKYKTNYIFCKLRISLTPIDERNPSRSWKIIEQTQRIDHCFNRNEVYYATSVPKIEDLRLQNLSEKYSKYGLTPKIKEMYCNKIQTFSEFTKAHDVILLCALICYINFVIYCSVKMRRKQEDTTQTKHHKYLEIFAIQNTWRNILKTNRNEDFQNLLSIQGIRTITIAVIIIVHNYLFYLSNFLDNPEYLENIFQTQQLFIGCFGLLVQTFFLISSWLLAVQLHNSVKKNGQLSGYEILSMGLKRYLRLVPNVIFTLVLHSSTLLHGLLVPPLYTSLSRIELSSCGKNWWTNLLFIQNVGDYAKELCMIGTWYLAADTQMYFFTLFLFYLSQKLKCDMKYLLGATVGMALALQVHTLMTTDYDGLLRFNPKLFPPEESMSGPTFTMSYGRTICNVATYAIGFMAGSIYCKNKQTEIFDSRVKKLFWFASFMGLPLLASFLYQKRISREFEVFIAVTLRPLFSLGIAIGILGMSTNTGGIIKKFFESRPLVFLGNFTYSVYMFHFLVMLTRSFHLPIFIHLNSLWWFSILTVDLILGFGIGITMYLILEGPCSELQKLLLPPVAKKKSVKTS